MCDYGLMLSRLYETMAEYEQLLTNVINLRDSVRVAWINSPVFLDGVLVDTQNFSIGLLLPFKVKTVLPSFFLYEKSWEGSDYINPFLFDWMLFDETKHQSYLLLLVSVMDEQLMFWEVDRPSTNHEVFLGFKAYVKAIKVFYDYIYGWGFFHTKTFFQVKREIQDIADALPEDWGLDVDDADNPEHNENII